MSARATCAAVAGLAARHFAESLSAALARAGVSVALSQLNVVLPTGISSMFQSMSYVINVSRGDITPTRNFIQFSTFVSFFPHLVAGPIMRPTSLLPQVANKRRFDLQRFDQGFYSPGPVGRASGS